MLNQNNVHEMTLTLDEAYNRFDKYNKSRNLAEETINTYYKNYIYFCEFLEHYQEKTHIPITKCSQITEDIMFEYIAYMKDCKSKKREREIKRCYYKYPYHSYKSIFYVLF